MSKWKRRGEEISIHSEDNTEITCLLTYHTPIQYTQTAVWQREVESSHCRRSSQTPGRCTVHPEYETGAQLGVILSCKKQLNV